ncbi:hypothetical protein TSTA_039920 [Talaromyces stipitatus ATCC 10500]|uniref:DUF7708 domain-containing protein n=1 Tax=Talaromyces stipitatus (strain ATCC 10500 / CBS 375.48 / QM 6759 / NRRL 1006) TaxID=441959 RepID=B8M455_TALSN|nr:uncharacterized protein TSTA_039920 [Talaromyces stipitatus ATCC 10500]EED20798.1 hypothetical protein TSTA_039920 [Talaromyces stipitatus ATCC 10500]
MLEDQIAIYDPNYYIARNKAFGALSEATGVQKSYQVKRRTGWRKVGHQAQTFVKKFADFMGVYSGIISLLKGAGGIYGEVAYETLSILFIVVVNKSANDSKIGDLLFELRRSFPKLDDWTSIYPTSNMKMLVTEVYKQVIEFARDASLYYTQFITRLWMAIGNPPVRGIDKIATRIHQKLAEVSSEATMLLHRRNQSIQGTVENNNARLKTVERQNDVLLDAYERIKENYERFRREVEAEREDQDTQRLQHFKEKLELPFNAPASTSLQAYASILQRAFPFASSVNPSPSSSFRQKSPSYQYMTSSHLSSLPCFAAWTASQTSCLLLLGGKTRPEARSNIGYTHSWLSPATIDVATRMKDRGARVAFYGCHAGVRADADGAHGARQMVSALLGQVVEWHPQVLRTRMVQWERLVDGKEWKGKKELEDMERERERERESESEQLRTWFNLLKEALSALREDYGHTYGNMEEEKKKVKEIGNVPQAKSDMDKVVYLVLDRIDLVQCSMNYFIKELVGLVRDEGCLIKVFVVMDTGRWVWDTDSFKGEERVIAMPDLDQKRVGLGKMPKVPQSSSI